jgi:hypothetical protein
MSLNPLDERSTADICCVLLRFVASTALPHDCCCFHAKAGAPTTSGARGRSAAPGWTRSIARPGLQASSVELADHDVGIPALAGRSRFTHGSDLWSRLIDRLRVPKDPRDLVDEGVDRVQIGDLR